MSLLRLLLAGILFFSINNAFSATDSVTPLVETSWLAEHLDNVVVLDVRTDKKSFVAKPVFRKDKKTGKQFLTRVGGHIPGAQFVLYKNVRGNRLVDGKKVKHMAVTGEKFEKIMRNAGVNQDTHIVITTNAEASFDLTMASRMYWQIKYYGHGRVSLLNGGTAQWIIDNRAISSSLNKVKPGNWETSLERESIFANSNEVMTAIDNTQTQIVDVRPLGQYLGTFKSSKAKAKGHIPSAKVFPVDLLSSRNIPIKFSSNDELKQLSKALGVDEQKPIITYCNSGHMASGGWFAFYELLGNKNVKLYDGSMHQWTHENRPVVSMIME